MISTSRREGSEMLQRKMTQLQSFQVILISTAKSLLPPDRDDNRRFVLHLSEGALVRLTLCFLCHLLTSSLTLTLCLTCSFSASSPSGRPTILSSSLACFSVIACGCQIRQPLPSPQLPPPPPPYPIPLMPAPYQQHPQRHPSKRDHSSASRSPPVPRIQSRHNRRPRSLTRKDTHQITSVQPRSCFWIYPGDPIRC